jgi:arsenate reductase-like glutaredoxin family protein
LRKLGVTFDEVNYAKRALSRDEVLAVVVAAGSVSAVLNGRHAVAKERGWVKQPPSAEEFAAAVAQESNLLRRPILLVDGRAIVGHDAAAYAALTG